MMAAPVLSPGDVAYLDYGEAPRCVHTRLVTGVVDRGTHEFTILTPDFDEYIEVLHQSNPDIVGIHFAGPGGGNPPGIPANVIYSFAPMTAAELAWWLGRGRMKPLQRELAEDLLRSLRLVLGGQELGHNRFSRWCGCYVLC